MFSVCVCMTYTICSITHSCMKGSGNFSLKNTPTKPFNLLGVSQAVTNDSTPMTTLLTYVIEREGERVTDG